MSKKMSVVCGIMLFLLMISGCNKQSYQPQTAATNQPQPTQPVQTAAPQALEEGVPHFLEDGSLANMRSEASSASAFQYSITSRYY
jgi:PBP1b-binding outer membrane lipoprotein LpoB